MYVSIHPSTSMAGLAAVVTEPRPVPPPPCSIRPANPGGRARSRDRVHRAGTRLGCQLRRSGSNLAVTNMHRESCRVSNRPTLIDWVSVFRSWLWTYDGALGDVVVLNGAVAYVCASAVVRSIVSLVLGRRL